MKKVKCETCSEEFEYEPIKIGSISFKRKQCDKCGVTDSEMKRRECDKRNKEVKELQWMSICPPLYRDTRREFLPLKEEVIDRVFGWKYNPKGLALAGSSGIGKTRVMFRLLHRLHLEDCSVVAISSKKFEYLCHKMFDEDGGAREMIENLKRVQVLFLDDLGKERMTPRVESEFYDLIETRTSFLLPTLWTTNCEGDELAQMMSKDAGAPIVRRLREFSDIITL